MSMSCYQAEEMLQYRLDNELDFAQSQQVDRHLTQCSSCRNALKQASSLRNALRRATENNRLPNTLRGRIGLSIERERRSSEQLSSLWPAVIASAILTCFIWHTRSPQAGLQPSRLHAAPGRQRFIAAAQKERQYLAGGFVGKQSLDQEAGWLSYEAHRVVDVGAEGLGMAMAGQCEGVDAFIRSSQMRSERPCCPTK